MCNANHETEINKDIDFNKQVQNAINVSCRILAIREHSEKQLEVKLVNKGYGPSVVKRAVNWVVEENWLSEERYCNSYIRVKTAKGYGKLRIQSELQQQNIEKALIDQSFVKQDFDWLILCKSVARKKLKSLLSNPSNVSVFEAVNESSRRNNHSIKIKLERFLRYRGFTHDQITTTLRQCLAEQESS